MNRTVRGTIDFNPEKQSRINYIINQIRNISKQFNAEEIDTPALEYTDLLLNKYGDEAETKLIYNLKDESLSLRYDMTVPLVRYLQANGIENMRRFQVGKVYRRDTPTPSKGRFCEFIQADFDIVGRRDVGMLSEAEIMKFISLVMQGLYFNNNNSYTIKVNFRQNLEYIIKKAGIDDKYFLPVCRIIDKLDKKSEEDVIEELINLKDENNNLIINENIAKKLMSKLNSNFIFIDVADEWHQFLNFCKIFGCDDKIEFDAKLARGLDYYTGMIYEVVLDNPRVDTIGTVIAGGRYDKLIKKKRRQTINYIPAIGVSFGVNRLELCMNDLGPMIDQIRIFVVSQQSYLARKLEVTNILLNAGYTVDYTDIQQRNDKQINNAIKNDYQFIVIVGEDGENQVKIKANDQKPDEISTIDNVVNYIQNYQF